MSAEESRMAYVVARLRRPLSGGPKVLMYTRRQEAEGCVVGGFEEPKGSRRQPTGARKAMTCAIYIADARCT